MASTEAQLRASEIKDVLLKQIEQYDEELKVEEVGEILEVKDGVARIYGLTNAMASEMLEITSTETGDTITALALNLEEDNIGAVVMGEWALLHEGDPVRRTGRVLDIPWAAPTSAASSTRSGSRSTARARSRRRIAASSTSSRRASCCGSR
jgi:F-type H+-transporting ATPase subunit alpha